MSSSFSAVYRRRIAQSDGASTEDEREVHAGATADTATEPPAIPHRRDESARHRDHAARERDRIAARRDREADTEDATALGLDDIDGPLGRRTLAVRRINDVEGREQASLSRERARNDRALAAIDRELGERDREASRRDRELGERDREASRRDREHAGTDELTGARRRGVGLEDLQREIDRAHRTGENLVAAYVDVDGLKAVNDEHGHHAGDQLLQDVVAALRRDMRSYDLLVRLGGDEFLCVMPGLTTEQARHRLEHLQTEPFPGPTVRSLSFGLSELRDGEGPMGLINRADQNLLAARDAR